MHDRQVDGLILASMYTRAIDVAEGIDRRVPPSCSTPSPSGPLRCHRCCPTKLEAGRAAARVLLDAGHRDGIHLIGAGPDQRDVPPGGRRGGERLEGIRTTLARRRREGGERAAASGMGAASTAWQRDASELLQTRGRAR